MSDLESFRQYHRLADQLIEKTSKDDVAECARLLAMSIAHYQSKFGELPLSETLAMLDAGEPNAEQLDLLSNSMEILIGVLGTVASGIDQSKH
ncbi:MAG: hypothetical protein PF589_09105 [Gammaproteobacteria bacterium]|jgi:hypothetical protein|nr:hypothetical protein [Gammaproteobacteria bacterium]